jgi:hypothetical protein
LGSQGSWFDSPVFYSRTYNGINFSYILVPSFTRDLKDVAYGNDVFIAVGTGGTSIVSAYGSSGIGTAWVVRSTPITNTLNSVTYANNGFVAVGNGGRIVTTVDGYTWNEVPSSASTTTQNLMAVSYVNDKYIAVGLNGTIIYSYNADIWFTATSNVSVELYSVIYTDGVYIITGENGLVLNSIDGINWNKRLSAITTNINKIISYPSGIIGVGTGASYAYSAPEKNRAQFTSTVSAAGTISALTIVDGGFGYNPSAPIQVLISPPSAKYEIVSNVDAVGDFGIITGIGTSVSGVGTTSPMLKFNFDCDDRLNVTKYGFIARSGISTGDYFIIKNSCVGQGVTSLDNGNVLGIGSTFIDNIYRADGIINDGTSGIVTVFSNVRSISGIGSTSFAGCGEYSWGKLYNFNTRTSPQEFKLNSSRGITGVSTAPVITRINSLKEEFT